MVNCATKNLAGRATFYATICAKLLTWGNIKIEYLFKNAKEKPVYTSFLA